MSSIVLFALAVFALSAWALHYWGKPVLDALRAVSAPFIFLWHIVSTLIGVSWWTYRKTWLWLRPPPYGDSQWATKRELKRAGNLDPHGFVVGSLNGTLLRSKWEYSLLMFGRPGAGKSATMGATLNAASGENMVVFDPPGTLLNRFQRDLEGKGYRVVVVDMDNPLGGACYDVCRLAEQEGLSIYDAEAVMRQLAGLVTSDVQGNSAAGGDHWSDAAEILIYGMLVWLLQEYEDERKRQDNGDVVDSARLTELRSKVNLQWVANILLSMSSSGQEEVFKRIKARGSEASLMAVKMWEKANDAKSGGEASGFQSTVTRALRPWVSQRFRDLTQWDGVRDRFSWDVLYESQPVAVFLKGGMLRGDDVKAFVRVFFGQAAVSMGARFLRDGKLNRRVKLMIDEGVVLGRCKPVFSAVEEMRKAGVTVFIGYQSMGQMRQIWGKEGAGTLADCCDVIVAGGSKTPADYLDLSQLIGSRTVNTVSRSEGRITEGEVGRHLHAIEQSFRMDEEHVVGLLGNLPVMMRKPFMVSEAGIDYSH